jgi:mannosyltransferase
MGPDTKGPEAGVSSAGTARSGSGPPAVLSRRLRDWLTLVVPAAAALLVCGYHLGNLSLWRDEAYSLEASDRSFGQIFALLHHGDAVNGTYYLFLHVAIAILGTSETALRLPSLLAIAVAAAMTAALGRLLARIADLPAPWLTGLLAGLLFVAAPQATRYAQNARAYAIVTMLVTIATYLLVRAMMAGTWRWWAWYAVAIALAGFFNLFSLLMVAAHGLTVLLARRARRPEPGTGGPAASPRRWLAAAAAAGIVLAPLAWLGFKQRGQISWLTKPGARAVYDLFVTFAGSKALIVPIAALALCGCAASLAAMSRPLAPAGAGAAVPAAGRAEAGGEAAGPGVASGPAALAIVTLPWLIVPPVALLAVSQFKPVYVVRYVFYCQPAVALLCAAGLAWLARVTASALPASALTGSASPRPALPGPARPGFALGSGRGRALAWLPAAAVAAALAAAMIAPQRAVRLPSSRPDNLRYISAVVAAHGRPADIVFYIPWNMRSLGMGYPAPFRRLRDIGLKVSPVQSNTLLGKEVSLATLSQRLHSVSRVWLVTAVSQKQLLAVTDHVERAELALIDGMRLIGHWHAGGDVLSLYTAR